MQQRSTKLKAVEQLELIAAPTPVSRPVSFDRIYLLENTKDALFYACELGRKVPKQIYPDMGCDKTTWSRIVSGEFDLDGRDIPRFNKVVGNNAYLMYLNHVDGIDLHSIRKTMDDKDKRIADLEAKCAEKDRALEVAAQLVSGRVPR